MMWQQTPADLPVMTHVPLSRFSQAFLTSSLRRPRDPNGAAAPGTGPEVAMNALIPALMVLMSARISDAVEDGDAMVFKRLWTSPGATRL